MWCSTLPRHCVPRPLRPNETVLNHLFYFLRCETTFSEAWLPAWTLIYEWSIVRTKICRGAACHETLNKLISRTLRSPRSGNIFTSNFNWVSRTPVWTDRPWRFWCDGHIINVINSFCFFQNFLLFSFNKFTILHIAILTIQTIKAEVGCFPSCASSTKNSLTLIVVTHSTFSEFSYVSDENSWIFENSSDYQKKYVALRVEYSRIATVGQWGLPSSTS